MAVKTSNHARVEDILGRIFIYKTGRRKRMGGKVHDKRRDVYCPSGKNNVIKSSG